MQDLIHQLYRTVFHLGAFPGLKLPHVRQAQDPLSQQYG